MWFIIRSDKLWCCSLPASDYSTWTTSYESCFMPLYTCSTFPTLPTPSHHDPSHSPGSPSFFQSSLIFHLTTCFLPCSSFCFVGVRLPLPSFGITWYDWKQVNPTFYCINTEKKPSGLKSGGALICQPLLYIAFPLQRHVWSSLEYMGTSGGLYVVKVLVLFQVRSDILASAPGNGWKKDLASGAETVSGLQLFIINQHS